MKIVFFGSSRHAIPIIEELKNNFKLSLVVTTEISDQDAVINYCRQNNIPFFPVKKIDAKAIAKIKKIEVTLAVVASFGLIIPKAVLNLFPKGIINVHPSLLPKYRGPTPVQTAIVNGDRITGVTIIKLDEEVDHGPILAEQEEKILPNDTAESLYERLFKKGAKLLSSVIQIIELKGEVLETAQNHSRATFTKHLKRESGYIDFQNPPTPEKLDRMVRAYYPWPGVWGKLKMKSFELRIKLLPNRMLQVGGKKEVSLKDFLNGYPDAKEQVERLFEKL